MQRTRHNYHPEDKVLLERGNELYYGKPDLILTSDWHLREDTPTCWIGDFWDEQWRSVVFVTGLQKTYGCPVVHAGDLFHTWKPSPNLLTVTMENIPDNFYTVFGQHDLPNHNLELSYKCGVKTLETARKVKVLDGYHWGQGIYTGASAHPIPPIRNRILVWHHLTYITKPYPEATGGMAEGILRKYPQFQLIVTGDNHTSFSVTHEGRLLVNPGNLTRQTADQQDYQPRVALWYAETNTIQWVNIPVKADVITREHIEGKEERDKRIEAFVSKLSGDYEVGVSFEQNLTAHFAANKTDKEVKDIIYKMIENER